MFSMKKLFPSTLAALAVIFGLSTATTQAIIIDGIDWTSVWEGNVVPNSAPGTTAEPSFSTFGGTFTVNSGTTTTAGTNAGASGPSPTSAWAGGTSGNGTDSILEFRVKVLTQGSEVDQPVGTSLFVGWNGQRFQLGLNMVGTNYAEFAGGSFLGTNTVTLDTTAWHTYRIVFFDSTNSASLYIDGINTGLTQAGSGGLADVVQFHRYTGAVSATGTSEWDYIRWTNAIPEPSALALLGLAAFTMGSAGLRRRRN